MRARVLWGVTATCLLIVVAAGAAVASSGRIAAEETIVVYSQTAKYHQIDVGPRGFSAGDQFVDFDTLFDNAQKTHQVGMDRVTCTYLPSKYIMCIDEFTITGRGKIETMGTLHVNAAFNKGGDSLAVSGGTGEFEGVSGSALLEFFDNETFKNTIHLLP
jgi:hypothetical protein